MLMSLKMVIRSRSCLCQKFAPSFYIYYLAVASVVLLRTWLLVAATVQTNDIFHRHVPVHFCGNLIFLWHDQEYILSRIYYGYKLIDGMIMHSLQGRVTNLLCYLRPHFFKRIKMMYKTVYDGVGRAVNPRISSLSKFCQNFDAANWLLSSVYVIKRGK